MTATNDSTVRFADGTSVEVDWVYPDAPQYEWLREREHWPDPMTPIEKWIWQHGVAGGDRAWAEIDLEPPPSFYRFQIAGPYLYVRMTAPSPEQVASMAPRYIAVSQEYGGALNFWTTYCEPRIIGACEELAGLDASADLHAAAELLFYGFHQTFTCLGLIFLPSMGLEMFFAKHGLPDSELTRFELTQGGNNATQDIDEEIWRLAELARTTPRVADLLQSSGDALADLRLEPQAVQFVAEFDALIERHGRRSQGWMLTAETWAERPSAALALVRAQVLADPVAPDELRRRTASRREETMARVLAALPPESHAELKGIVSGLDGYVYIREGRAYWQLVISGAMRGLLLRIGADLVAKGRIDRADDVFFVTPDDFAGDSTSDLRSRVAAARDEWARAKQFDPPLVIGTPAQASAEAETKRAEFRGSPASRGIVTAKVRILANPEEGPRLHSGEILVCAMTTPAWTPLFAIAGGIITETGGALSHPAITAREYGIPAVVALADATTRLKDGDIVTIDGATGTVTIG